MAGDLWALILAGGDGSRLRLLTTPSTGPAIPKQFCSLRGNRSLLDDAILRAKAVTAAERVCAIVADQHRQWWQPSLRGWPCGNVMVQPQNRGTALGVLYGVLHILARDPEARIVVLPSDHFVLNETLLHRSVLEAIGHSAHADGVLTIVGMEPEEVDPELGYILPSAADGEHVCAVTQFIEKPNEALARQIIHDGALWNTLIMAGAGRSIVDLYFRRYAPLAMEMHMTLERARSAGLTAAAVWSAMTHLYQRLPDLDFSRHILQAHAHALHVLKAPRCGWSDIGTPAHVGATLERLPEVTVEDESATTEEFPLNIAARHAQIMGATLPA